jgi:hypothetical protein
MAPAEQFREFTVGGISGRSHLDEIRLDRGADRAGLRAKPGKYQGHFHDGEGERLEEFTFRVSRDGRKLKRFRALLGVICSYYPPTVEAHPFGYPTVRITRRHTFRKVWKPNGQPDPAAGSLQRQPADQGKARLHRRHLRPGRISQGPSGRSLTAMVVQRAGRTWRLAAVTGLLAEPAPCADPRPSPARVSGDARGNA